MLGNDALRFQHVLVDKGTPVLEQHGCHRCVCLLKLNFNVYKLKLKTDSCRSNANRFPVMSSWFAGDKTKGSPVTFDEHLQGFHQKYVFPIVPFSPLLCIPVLTVSIQNTVNESDQKTITCCCEALGSSWTLRSEPEPKHFAKMPLDSFSRVQNVVSSLASRNSNHVCLGFELWMKLDRRRG